MFYLTTLSTHCIHGYMAAEGMKCLFNDALSTLYTQLYGGRKEGTVYLTTHSAHCTHGYMAAEGRKELFI